MGKKSQSTFKKVLGTGLALAVVGGVVYGGVKLVQNWNNVTDSVKDYVTTAELEKVKKDLEAEKETTKTLTEQKTTLEAEVTQLQTELDNEKTVSAEKQALLDGKITALNEVNKMLEASNARVTELEAELNKYSNFDIADPYILTAINYSANDGSTGYIFHGERVADSGANVKSEIEHLKSGFTITNIFEDVKHKITYIKPDGSTQTTMVSYNQKTYTVSAESVPFRVLDSEGNEIEDISVLTDDAEYYISVDNLEFTEEEGDLTSLSFDIVITPKA